MKRIFIILCLITICNISYGDIASVGYVDSVVATKQDTISDIETIRTGAGLGATAVQPSSLSTVATSGSYNDLSNKPTLSTVATSGSYNDLSGKPTLATVATSGSYNDLSNKPTIPSLPTGPSGGRYNLVWNGNTGKFVFELVPGSCPSGTYDIGFSQCIDPAKNGTGYGYINDSVHSWLGPDSYNASKYGLTQDNTWGLTLYTGDKIKGEALCSSTDGTYAKPGNPDEAFDEDTSQYCWCRMTSPAVSRWVFFGDDDFSIFCAHRCVDYCASFVHDVSDFRSVVFGSVE
ncbi:MAG: hypothetical protein KBS86_03185 [Proteobacteria bacterium]|nr:hypothetical protein [Candidatus Enterousia scatequi]